MAPRRLPTVLMNLLPGLRDLRTPLAVGYLWLTALWLVFGNRVPDPGDASGLVHDLYRAASAVGTTASLAALTFTAYLMGTRSLVINRYTDILWRLGADLRNRREPIESRPVGVDGGTWYALSIFA